MKNILKEAAVTLGNLLSPREETPLEALWKDTGGSCLVERPAGWERATVDVSVIIPCYNNAKYLGKSLRSVLEQRGDFTFEAVVIDDGSTDETPELLEAFRGDPRVVLRRQENRGHSGARNTGLSLCRGEYILFHDSDDTLCPGALAALLTTARAQDADIVAGGYLRVSPEGEVSPGKTFPDGVARDIYTIPGMTCGKIFRRRLFRNLRFPEGYWYEDSIICQILLPMARGVYTVSSPIFYYLLNPQGVSAASRGQKKSLESVYVTRRLLRERERFGLTVDAPFCGHFLHMVALTYHRTRHLGRQALYPVFLAQREMFQAYFGEIPVEGKFAPLARALRKGQFRRYVWQCEVLWLGGTL